MTSPRTSGGQVKKRLISTIRVPLLLFGVALLSLETARAKLVAHWDFDAFDGQVADVIGTCHGVPEGENWPDRLRPGIFGNALLFDAGRSQIRLPFDEPLFLRNNFTIEYVIKPFRTDGFRTILWQGDRTITPELISYYVDLRDGRPELKTKDADGRWIVYSTPTVLSADSWHHVVITFHDGQVDILIDGITAKVSTSENGRRGRELLPNLNDVILGNGASPDGPAYPFCGLIDDIKIYQGAQKRQMLAGDYMVHWRGLRHNVLWREKAFEKDLELKKKAEHKRMEDEYDALFETHATNSELPFIVTVLPASEPLVGAPDFFRHIRHISTRVTMSAARQEYEGCQVVLMAPRTGGDVNVTVSVSDLVHADGTSRIPAKDISWGRVGRVTTEEPDIPVPFVGAIPDVIFADGSPVIVPPRDFAEFYYRVYTRDAPPGRYSGTITLACGNSHQKIDVILDVYNFTLPRRPSLRTAFCFFERFYRDWYRLDALTDEQKGEIYEFLLDYRLSPCNIYSADAPHPDLRFLQKYRDRINFFTIGRIRGKEQEEIRQNAAARAELLKQLRAMGLEEYAYYYGVDELSMNMQHLPEATMIADALREAWPEIKMMQTSPPIPELQPIHNVWVPLFHQFGNPTHAERIQNMRQRGDRIWWYAADAPRHPNPNFFLDYPVLDCRIIGALSHLYHVEGILYWCINREWKTNIDIQDKWPQAQWKPYIFHIHNGTRKHKNGMGNLVYPGPKGKLCASLRLENLRDGLEDYEYFHALENAIVQLEQSGTPGAKALLAEAQSLLLPPTNVARSINCWSSDPTNLLQYRDRVGNVLTHIAEISQ